MADKKALSPEEKKNVLEAFCVRPADPAKHLTIVCHGEPQNRKTFSEDIRNDAGHIYFVVLLESNNVTLKATNGSSTNLKELFKEKNLQQLLGVVRL